MTIMAEETKEKVFQFVDAHKDEMLALWKELVGIESGSDDKAGVDAVAVRLERELKKAGATTRIIPMAKAGNMLVGEFGARNDQQGVLFIGHMDTVFKAGTLAERPFTIREGKAYGPGVLDMKGGIVTFLYAIKALKAAGYDTRTIKIVLAGDEEIGHENSNATDVFAEEAKGYAAAFNCETGFVDDGIVVGRKGSVRFTIDVQGVAAHVGNDPENGRNAILEMSHKVIAIQALTDWEEGTTYNVGTIQGGTVANAVPDHAKIIVDVRYKDPALLPDIQKKMEQIADKTYVDGTHTVMSMRNSIIPMKTTDEIHQLFSLVKTVYQENGFGEPYEKSVGGGSDSAYTVLAGVPTVCAMGVKGGRNHSPEEYAVVDTLFERAKLLAACVLKLK